MILSSTMIHTLAVLCITCCVLPGAVCQVPKTEDTGVQSSPMEVISGAKEGYEFFYGLTLVPDPIPENITANDTRSPKCGETIIGSFECLHRYDNFGSKASVNYTQYLAIRPKNCNDTTVYFPCKDDVADQTTDFVVGSDPSYTTDNDPNTLLAWPIESGKSASLTYKLGSRFKVAAIALVLHTLPVEIIVYGSINGESEQLLKRFQMDPCDDTDSTCSPNPRYGDYLTTDRVLLIDMDEDINDDDYTFAALDTITLTFPGINMWNEYHLNHIVIEQVTFISTCACENEGVCSNDIDQSSDRSVKAKYSCECPDGLSGFTCGECADDYYKTSSDSTLECTACDCGPGAINSSCSEGVCMCNDSFYDSNKAPDSKCKESYITSIEPLTGPVSGGTLITITGGLLTELEFNNCELEIECPNAACLDRNAEFYCRIKPGTEVSSFSLIESDNITYSYQYTENPSIESIQPMDSFAEGGKVMTLTGLNLDVPEVITLVYNVECTRGTTSSWQIAQSCESQSATVAHCTSPNFCTEQNKCEERTGETTDNCAEDRGTGVIGNTPADVNIKVAVQIDSLALQDNITADSFTISQNPVIKKWDKDTLMIKNNADSFEIPGLNLNSGVTAEDYIVIINGVRAEPISVSETRLKVRWPESKPFGVTTVDIGIGNLKETVGNLKLEEDNTLWIVLAIVFILIIMAVMVTCILLALRRKRRQQREKNLQKLAYKPGNVRYVKQNGETGFIPLGYLVNDSELVEQLKPFLIDNERITLLSQIGGGQFGTVYRGSLRLKDDRDLVIAAKTLKAEIGITEEKVTGFLMEATLMSNFNHPNVLDLIGVAYTDGRLPSVILPYMQNGDIRALVQSEDQVFVLGDLLHFAMQIARGMEYLSERRFIHRDLAARNCMVDENYVVKIADFGLSHDIYEDDYYRTDENSNKPLPVKWMALESLNSGKYTTESDIWSYGIVMWELLTRGITPYPNVSNYDIKTHLRSGERLTQPDHCPDVIYDMMKGCWEVEPESRPDFKSIADKLEAILNDSHYEERSKTKEIESDYYKEPLDKSDMDDLYVEVIE